MSGEIVSAKIDRYLAGLRRTDDAVLAAMEREADLRGFPIVGPLVGRLLLTLALASGARRVLELGSGYGYSTYWFATAVGDGGLVIHTDFDADNSRQAAAYLTRAGLGRRVRFETGDALDVLRKEAGMFDIIFCDIDKEAYPEVPALALPKLRQRGLLIFDNALWSGRVTTGRGADPATAAIRRLNTELAAREDLVTTILPLRDGVSVSVKR
ncbi:MAG: O-methyltransferase [Deltaproteobacteria bacterium]|nr:O-methyltransferase [Deltaproteobacteria bacterium]